MTSTLDVILAYAKTHPWYEDRLARATTFTDVPVLTRQDLYAVVDAHAVRALAKEPVYWSPTSGTSSSKLFFFPSLKSENDLQRRRLAPYFQACGLFREGDVFFNLFPTGGIGRGSEIFESFAELAGVTSLPLGHHLPPDQTLSVVDRFAPNVVGGMPNALLDLAAANLAAPRQETFERVLFGGEALTEGKLTALRKAFSCTGIYGIYGSAEAGILGVTLDGSGTPRYVVPKSIGHVEVIERDQDGVGDIVVTNLVRQAFPLLRYHTGDRGRLISEDDAAIVLEFVGRQAASFQLAGEIVLVEDLLEGLTAGENLEDIQFVLTHFGGRDHLEVRVVTMLADESFARFHDALLKRLNAMHGVGISVKKAERGELIRKGYSRKPPLVVDQRE